MATYTYRAFTEEGLSVSGSFKASSEEEIKRELDNKNLSGAQINKSKTRYQADSYVNVPPKQLAIFCRQVSVLFFSHITLIEGVDLLADQTENDQLVIALNEMRERMDEGITFAEAIGMYPHIFGSYLINMTVIGETSGSLDTVFDDLSEYFDKEHVTHRKLKQAVTYPAILSVMMGAIVLLLVLKIIPLFESILVSRGGSIPGITRAILAVSRFINNYILIIAAIIIGIIAFFTVYRRSDKGRVTFDKLAMKFGPTRYLTERVITARFSRSLALLLKSGVNLINSLEESKLLVNNVHLEKKFDVAIEEIKDGGSLDEALDKIGVFPPLFIRMLIIGQETGHIDEMLYRSAGIFDEEVDEAIDRLTTLIEPVLIIFLSIIVGIILVSVMVPMIDVMNTIS